MQMSKIMVQIGLMLKSGAQNKESFSIKRHVNMKKDYGNLIMKLIKPTNFGKPTNGEQGTITIFCLDYVMKAEVGEKVENIFVV